MAAGAPSCAPSPVGILTFHEMKHSLLSLHGHPRLVSVVGAISGWFSVENIARAKDAAQLAAALLAALVSLCALILTGPKAVAELRRLAGLARAWLASLRS